TTDLISQSLQALLERLSPNSDPPAAVEPAPPATAPAPGAPGTLRPRIPCPALPDAYDGARSSGERFLQSCLTYIHLSRDAFDSDVLKIAWVLSYMKTGHASTYALRVFRRSGALVEQAAYPDGLQLCLTFRDGLHPALVKRIDNLAEGHPNNERIASWYEVARDQWQLMEIQRELRCPHSTLRPAPVSHFRHYPGLTPPAPAIPAARPLPPGIPMDVDAARQLQVAPLLCQRCKKSGHFARHCPLGLEVRYLSMAEQEELLLQLLVAKDAAGAPSLDDPAPELILGEANGCSSPPELEGDF
ncbi:hypothetical protein C0995_015781, partial [Termitomyces sp. Mi166